MCKIRKDFKIKYISWPKNNLLASWWLNFNIVLCNCEIIPSVHVSYHSTFVRATEIDMKDNYFPFTAQHLEVSPTRRKIITTFNTGSITWEARQGKPWNTPHVVLSVVLVCNMLSSRTKTHRHKSLFKNHYVILNDQRKGIPKRGWTSLLKISWHAWK